MSAADDILFEARGALGLITLNRPQTLNALTLDMIHRMQAQLDAWATDSKIGAVLITGAGGKAFCSGGDVRALHEPGNEGLAEVFFRDEYRLNRTIFRYPKPYLALIDGIAMGGGVGVAVHARYRIVTEATVFAMPETAIGMFPDVGGSYFLPRMPGELGIYLALTGARMSGLDCLYANLAEVYIPSARRHAELVEALAGGESPVRAIRRLHEHQGLAELADQRQLIDHCFSGEAVEEIIERLSEQDGEWAAKTREAMLRMSPLAMKITLRELRRGKQLTFENCMTMEYRISQRIAKAHDFREGVRAVLVDKDRKPRWNPARLEDVSDEQVEAFFAPLDGNELVFPG